MREARTARNKESGTPQKPQEPVPILFPDLLWIWSAFCYLSERRGVGPHGPVPVTVEAMSHFSTLTNRRERVYVDQLIHFIPILDREYMRDFYDKQAKAHEDQRKKSESQSRRGARSSSGLNRR